MGPLRIIILAVLLYIGYRLLTKSLRQSDNRGERDGDSAGRVTDVLIEDPICRKLVPKQQALRLKLRNKEHYFCSQACYDTYIAQQGDDT